MLGQKEAELWHFCTGKKYKEVLKNMRNIYFFIPVRFILYNGESGAGCVAIVLLT